MNKKLYFPQQHVHFHNILKPKTSRKKKVARSQGLFEQPGLYKLWYPCIRDTITWRTWRCFPVLQLRCALILRELNQIFIACLFKGSQKQSVFLQTLLFKAFLVTVLKILTYALVSTSSSVSSGYEHVKQKMHPWLSNIKGGM